MCLARRQQKEFPFLPLSFLLATGKEISNDGFLKGKLDWLIISTTRLRMEKYSNSLYSLPFKRIKFLRKNSDYELNLIGFLLPPSNPYIRKLYAKTKRHAGEVIPRKISLAWMTKVGVVNNLVSEMDADEGFRQAAGSKVTLNAQEYKDFLIDLTIRKKLPFYEIYRRMCGL
ncbi:uncharacterized protein LOC118183803 [Stegodyphus dumicola]|uniref:uncharacterized protein LOC118183803 n=1 Tax=Stegodyphus dumicola TaxID=202533 RepID=UPI0015B0D746|nr:uncharacterized protein LOC118183803 [Stegodyphus dumicola]